MSTKLEIRTKMAALQKEYSTLAAQLKDLDQVDRLAATREKFKDYKFMVFAYGYNIPEDAKLVEVNDAEREHGTIGRTGIAYVEEVDQNANGMFILLKSEDELPRIRLLFERMNAVQRIEDKHETDVPKYVKILLGEKE